MRKIKTSNDPDIGRRPGIFKKFIYPYIEYESSVLDVGSGDGRKMGHKILSAGWLSPINYHAIDAQLILLEKLKEWHPEVSIYHHDLLKENLTNYLPHLEFDIVFMTEIIEHMAKTKDQVKLLKQAVDLLKNSGFIMISFPENVRLNNKKWGHKCQKVDLPAILGCLDNFTTVDSFKVRFNPTSHTDSIFIIAKK